MPRKKRAPEKDDLKDRILDGALHVFAQKGYHGTTIPDVAKQAGVAAGTLYNHFQNKHDLVNAVYWKWKAAFRDALDWDREGKSSASVGPQARVEESGAHATASPEPFSRREFERLIESVWHFARTNAEAYQFLEAHHHSDYLSEHCRQLADDLAAEGFRFIERGQRAGLIRPAPPLVLLSIVIGALNELFKQQAHGRDLKETDEVASIVCSSLWNAVCVVSPP